MFTHCNRKFKSIETWFLYDNKDFTRRKLYLGTCPICGADVCKIVETRKSDGAIFPKTLFKKDAQKTIQRALKEINYTSAEVKKFKRVPYGLCYGENIEVHNHKGEIIEIRQKRCDYFGTKEVILRIKPSYSS